MYNWAYYLCVAFSLISIWLWWKESTINPKFDDGFIVILILVIKPVVFFIINWLFNFKEPLEMIFKRTGTSFVYTGIAYIVLAFIAGVLLIYSLYAGMWNR